MFGSAQIVFGGIFFAEYFVCDTVDIVFNRNIMYLKIFALVWVIQTYARNYLSTIVFVFVYKRNISLDQVLATIFLHKQLKIEINISEPNIII